MKTPHVQEVSGLYGPLSISERVLQKLWLRRAFTAGTLVLDDGRALKILDPGRWNHREGPDFRDARLEIDGKSVVGDVEIHFSIQDWFNHSHDIDPNYGGVILHAVLFRPPHSLVVPHKNTGIPTFVMGEHLAMDLESFAEDDALLEMSTFDMLAWAEHFIRLPEFERFSRVSRGAWQRWTSKVHHAKDRINADGYEQACHSWTLEVLGYPRNRAPMARLAQRHPWSDCIAESFAATELLYAEEYEAWRIRGHRPASHPAKRLQQYGALVSRNPRWIEHARTHLLNCAPCPFGDSSAIGAVPTTRELRRTLSISPLRRALHDEILAGVFGTNKADSIAVDVLLPLAAAQSTDQLSTLGYFWMAWPVGNFPENQNRFIHDAFLNTASQASVRSNGLSQGTFALFLNEGVI